MVIMSGAEAIFAILASAVVVLGGLIGVVRAIWKVANTLRDNTTATRALSASFGRLTDSIDGRFDALTQRVTTLEIELAKARRRRPRQGDPP